VPSRARAAQGRRQGPTPTLVMQESSDSMNGDGGASRPSRSSPSSPIPAPEYFPPPASRAGLWAASPAPTPSAPGSGARMLEPAHEPKAVGPAGWVGVPCAAGEANTLLPPSTSRLSAPGWADPGEHSVGITPPPRLPRGGERPKRSDAAVGTPANALASSLAAAGIKEDTISRTSFADATRRRRVPGAAMLLTGAAMSIIASSATKRWNIHSCPSARWRRAPPEPL